MPVLTFDDSEALGKVIAVDTGTVVVKVGEVEKLRKLQVNRLAALQSSKAGQHLIGVIQRITRRADDEIDSAVAEGSTLIVSETNLVRVALIGTLMDRKGSQIDTFQRTLETVPEIDANCFSIEGERLTAFMRVISNVKEDGPRLSIGTFTLDDSAVAFLNGNKLFQRHAIVVGSTGSGKSFAIARILEQAAELPSTNIIVFDIHGEYAPLKDDSVRHFKVAGPSDLESNAGTKEGILYLPYWLLGYEALVALLVDRSDQNAPNQSMMMTREITEAKRAELTKGNHTDILKNFTIDSPVPFALDDVIRKLDQKNKEMVPAKSGEKQGEFHGKLSRLLARVDAKRTDRRLGFLFQPNSETMNFEWLIAVAKLLMAGRAKQGDKRGGIKIIDFSEVPSDILPLIVSLLAHLVFTIQQWTESDQRHPIALLCEEAHLYIPERAQNESADAISVGIFERIAKEGRKYGVGLIVISQRPAEVNRTVLSQCNNVISMRLTNGEDQAVIRKLLPDSLETV